jgi:hypothetical protein
MALTRISLTFRSAVAVALAVLVAGCAGSTPGSAGSSTEGATATQGTAAAGDSASAASVAASEAASTPAVEGTGAESPQQPANGGPTISVAALPVGGDKDSDGARQCAHVNLITQNQLPKWVSISIDSIGLSSEGIFSVGGDLCGSARPPCEGYSWTLDTAGRECAVDVTQIKDSDETVTLVLAGTVHCRDQQACDDVQRAFDGPSAQIQFTASTGVVSTESSSPSETPPSDTSASETSPSATSESSTSTEASTAGG